MTPELARLILGQLCLHASMAGFRMAAPLLALRQGVSEVGVGVLLALFALTQVFLALPAGRYADRHGLRRPLGWSVVVACLAGGAAWLWPVYGVLCLGALMLGGATGAASIALQRHVGRAAEGGPALRKVFSWLAIGPAVSNFIGPFAAGLLIDAGGFRWAFAFLALLPVLTWWCVRRAPELPNLVDQAPASAHRKAWDLLTLPDLRRLLLVNWVLAACWDVHTFVVPVLGHERGLSASVIGTILGAFAVAAAGIRLVLPLLAERLREWQVLVVAMLCAAVLLAGYPWAQAPWAMGVLSVLLGVALGSVQPMIMSMLHQATPPARLGEGLALRLMAINASSVAMPLVFGALGSVVGVQLVFWAVAATVGGVARVAAGLARIGASTEINPPTDRSS